MIKTTNEVCELHKGQRVADFCPINSAIPPDLPATNRQALVGSTLNVSNEVAYELSSALSSTLSPCARNTLLTTLLRYVDVFEHSLGHTSVSHEDKEKNAFVTPTGSWEFLRIPFGLSGAPVSFDHAMQIIMSDLNCDSCLCYFDDIIIPSKGIQEHCERLEKILTRISQHNLRVKASKCCFAAPKVLYLGHTVSAKGIYTDPEKIKAVFELSEPSSLEQVQSFLGLAGYYRKFIPNSATVAAPLTDLTKKGYNLFGLHLNKMLFLR